MPDRRAIFALMNRQCAALKTAPICRERHWPGEAAGDDAAHRRHGNSRVGVGLVIYFEMPEFIGKFLRRGDIAYVDRLRDDRRPRWPYLTWPVSSGAATGPLISTDAVRFERSPEAFSQYRHGVLAAARNDADEMGRLIDINFA